MSGITASRHGDASSLLELLQNSALLEQRLEQLKKAEAQANEVIKLAGPASEIVAIREQLAVAQKAMDEAKAKLAQDVENQLAAAHKEGQAIIDAAEKEAEAVAERAASLRAEAESLKAIAKADAAASHQHNEDLQRARVDCEAREKELHARILELEEERSLLADQRKKLAEVRESIITALG